MWCWTPKSNRRQSSLTRRRSWQNNEENKRSLRYVIIVNTYRLLVEYCGRNDTALSLLRTADLIIIVRCSTSLSHNYMWSSKRHCRRREPRFPGHSFCRYVAEAGMCDNHEGAVDSVIIEMELGVHKYNFEIESAEIRSSRVFKISRNVLCVCVCLCVGGG